MRRGILTLNSQHRSLLSNDLGAVTAFLFEVGTGRYPLPEREGDGSVERWRSDLDQVRAESAASAKAVAAAREADHTHTEIQGWLRDLGIALGLSGLDCVERRSAVLQRGAAGGRVPRPIARRPFRSRRCGCDQAHRRALDRTKRRSSCRVRGGAHDQHLFRASFGCSIWRWALTVPQREIFSCRSGRSRRRSPGTIRPAGVLTRFRTQPSLSAVQRASRSSRNNRPLRQRIEGCPCNCKADCGASGAHRTKYRCSLNRRSRVREGGYRALEIMPSNACQFFRDFKGCGAWRRSSRTVTLSSPTSVNEVTNSFVAGDVARGVAHMRAGRSRLRRILRSRLQVIRGSGSNKGIKLTALIRCDTAAGRKQALASSGRVGAVSNLFAGGRCTRRGLTGGTLLGRTHARSHVFFHSHSLAHPAHPFSVLHVARRCGCAGRLLLGSRGRCRTRRCRLLSLCERHGSSLVQLRRRDRTARTRHSQHSRGTKDVLH